MQSIDKITEYLKENLSESRYRHTLGVAETAVALAEVWGADKECAYLAGLVHDCAKEIPLMSALELMEQAGERPCQLERESTALLHGSLGAVLARTIFDIQDNDVLNAIRYHTTGRENMTILEKIIYVADFIEPNRTYSEAELVKEIAYTDIDKAVLMESDIVIKFTINRGRKIHPYTIFARNYFLNLTKEGNINES